MPLRVLVQRFIRYVIKQCIKQYVSDFSALELGLSHGKAENILLDTEALNTKCLEYNLPFEILHGCIDLITYDKPPIKNVLTESSVINVKGLNLVVQLKQRPEDVSMFDSMWGSMTSSLQLVEECLNANEGDEEILASVQSGRVPNLKECLTQFLDNLKIRFHDSSFVIKHALPNQTTGISLEIKIASAEYFDESCVNIPPSGLSRENEKCESSAYSFKRVVLEGISLFIAEFLSEDGPFSLVQQVFSMKHVDPSKFIPGSPEMPPTHASLNMKKTDEQSFHCDPLLICKLNGQHEIRLKLKRKEAVLGPKVDVEFNFGAINLFLIPQQVHLLYILMKGFMKPTDRSSGVFKKAQLSVNNKPMRPADYALVEQELLRQQDRSEVMSRSLKNQQGWSSHSLDESDEDFHLMTMENKVSHEATPFNSSQDDIFSSMNSDIKPDCGGYNPRTKSKGSSVQAILADPLSELTHFHGCVSSLLMIILHDDSVQETFTGDTRSDSDSLADIFFRNLKQLQLSGLNFKDFFSIREPISKLCETNHLRLMASGIVIDGSEASSSVECILKFNISFHQFEVLECLFNSPAVQNEVQISKYMQLMTFVKKDGPSPDQKEVCFKLSYSQVECISQNRTNKLPAKKLDIELDTLMCDVDISLTDRIRTLLNFSNVADYADTKRNCWMDSDVGSLVTRTSSKTDVTLSSSCVTINLRFPVPDLRSVHDMERTPWWQQNIHKEILVLELQDISFKTTLDDDELFEKYEIQCQDIHGLFKMSSSEEAISFLRVSVDPDIDEVSRNDGFDWPRLVIRRMTKVTSPDLEGAFDDIDKDYSCSLSYDLDLMANKVKEPSPFCSTKVIHCNKEEANVLSDHDEIVKPSDKKSMLNFIEQTTNKSECVFEFTLPTVNVVLPSREFYELLYNRLGTDLLLWENTSLISTSTYDSSGFKVHIPGLDVSFNKGPHSEQYPVFKPFSNDNAISNSNSDSEEEDPSHMSVHEYCHRHKEKHKQSNNANLTKLSFSFAIAKGCLLLNTPLLDYNNKIVPDHCGKLKLHAEDSQIFLALSYKGDPNESYMCLLAEKSTLYHEGSQEKETKHPTVQTVTGFLKNNMTCIIYESEQGMLLNSSNKEMLKVAVHVVKSPKQQIKTFKVAIGIAGATLRHYMVPPTHIWLNQMIDFLKVQDFPVSGYTPPSVVTELHLNLSNCAIDYRPIRLPYRAALTLENFNISCNVTATTPSFLMFRIISEELRLFLSNNTEAKKVNLRNNYVCVTDTGLISISIKTSQDKKINPKFEMSVFNNKMEFRTSADSFKGFLEFINYFSLNGDLEPDLCSQKKNEDLKQRDIKSKNIDSDSEYLDELMAEAMKECLNLNGNDEKFKNSSDIEYSNTDDEFCILEDDPGVGLIPRNGEPQIRVLTDGPIKIIENHFAVPPGKSDLLKTSKHFSNPLIRLKLEMSLVWNLYGGNDFKKCNSVKIGVVAKSDNPYKPKNGVTFSDQGTGSNESVSFCKTHVPKNFGSNVAQISNLESWLHKGGPDRKHDVLMELKMNKVQFRRDINPLDSEYASRIVLLIQDIQIIDHLAVSQIKTFLYQYETKDFPRQSNAYMIEVKAYYSRPDPKRLSEECSLRISLPDALRLNIDQDSLMFLVEFFEDVLKESDAENAEMHDENVPSNGHTTQDESSTSETFYKCFTFSPDVLIKIDYQGKGFHRQQGAIKGALFGYSQLNSFEIKLKRICYRHGLLGLKKLISYALNEWQQDILKNQMASFLASVGPMHPFVQLFQGVKDLFYMPVIQYQRDGQIVRGLRRGFSSFTTSSFMALLDFISQCSNAVQGTASVVFDMVNPNPRTSGRFLQCHKIYRRNSQPADFIEGTVTAYNTMKEGLGDHFRTVCNVASTEHEHKGVPGAVGCVIRQIPPTIFKPFILGGEAANHVVAGVRHQLMPDVHQENIHKWRTKNK